MKEFYESGIPPSETTLNFNCITELELIERLTEKKPEAKRLYKALGGGWRFKGYDLLKELGGASDDGSTRWSQIKPENPRKNKEGKIVKYESPLGQAAGVYIPAITGGVGKEGIDRFKKKTLDKATTKKLIETSKEKSGECSREYWEWVLKNKEIPVCITEGAKKAVSWICKTGIPTVGLAGIWNFTESKGEGKEAANRLEDAGNKNKKLKRALKMLVEGREVIIAFDNDEKLKTRQNIDKASAGLAAACRTNGATRVSIMKWKGQKGIDDYVVSGRDVEKIIEERFESRALKGLIERDRNREIKEKEGRIIYRLNSRYIEKEHIKEIIKILEKNEEIGIVGIKSAKGTGKTELLKGIVEWIETEVKTLVLTHRKTLGREQSRRLGLPYIEDLGEGEVRRDQRAEQGYVCCLDSAKTEKGYYPMRPESFSYVIMDELTGQIDHLLNATTLTKNRAEILVNVSNAMRSAISKKGKIIAADADLDERAIELLKTCIGTGEVKELIIINDYKFKKGYKKAIVYRDKKPDKLICNLIESLKLGKKELVFTGAKTTSSMWSTKVLAEHIRKILPDLKILHLDADTVSEPGSEAYIAMSDLNDSLGQYDLVISSPVLQTGNSIEIKGHFDNVWLINGGVSSINNIAQSLERLRDFGIPRHIWVPKSVNSIMLRGSGGCSKYEVLTGTTKKNQALLNSLTGVGREIMRSAIMQDRYDFPLYNFEGIYAQDVAIFNAEAYSFRHSLTEKLESDDYEVLYEDEIGHGDDMDTSDTVDSLKETRNEVDEIEVQAIANEKILDDPTYEKLSEQTLRTATERQCLTLNTLHRKYALDYPDAQKLIEISPELYADLIIEDRDGLSSSIKNLAFLLHDEDNSLLQDYSLMLVQSRKRRTNFLMSIDAQYKSIADKILFAKRTKLLQFLNPEESFTSHSLKQYNDYLLSVKQEVKIVFNTLLSVTDSPIKNLNKILKSLFGKQHVLKFSHKEGSASQQMRHYRSSGINERNLILAKLIYGKTKETVKEWVSKFDPTKLSDNLLSISNMSDMSFNNDRVFVPFAFDGEIDFGATTENVQPTTASAGYVVLEPTTMQPTTASAGYVVLEPTTMQSTTASAALHVLESTTMQPTTASAGYVVLEPTTMQSTTASAAHVVLESTTMQPTTASAGYVVLESTTMQPTTASAGYVVLEPTVLQPENLVEVLQSPSEVQIPENLKEFFKKYPEELPGYLAIEAADLAKRTSDGAAALVPAIAPPIASAPVLNFEKCDLSDFDGTIWTREARIRLHEICFECVLWVPEIKSFFELNEVDFGVLFIDGKQYFNKYIWKNILGVREVLEDFGLKEEAVAESMPRFPDFLELFDKPVVKYIWHFIAPGTEVWHPIR